MSNVVNMAEYGIEKWIKSRPECVRKLVEEFPPNTAVDMPDGKRYYLVGYTEGDELILSAINPYRGGDAYEKALADSITICAQHLRDDFDKTEGAL